MKLQAIKEIKNILNLGLKEAKEMVEGAPRKVLEGKPMTEIEALKAKLEAIGCVLTVI